MSETPEGLPSEPTSNEPTSDPSAPSGWDNPPPPQPWEQAGGQYPPPPPPGYDAPQYQQPYQEPYQDPYQQGYQQPYQDPYQQAGYPAPGYAWGATPGAPYGIHPQTGLPYSDKSKLVAGLLQILIPLGIGRMYMGQTGLGVAQLLVTIFTCGIGALWPFIDGIVILATDSKDAQGRPLKS